jgi:hypothetical protein
VAAASVALTSTTATGSLILQEENSVNACGWRPAKSVSFVSHMCAIYTKSAQVHS